MITVLIELFLSFFKIGFFGFGGGYAMISLIQEQLVEYDWMSMEKFVDIIAISEMTPGAVGVNSGTFVGYEVASLLGSVVAVLGVLTPSFILVLILAHFFKKIKNSNYVNNILLFLRPTVIALIFAAALTVARTSSVDIVSLIITISVFLLMFKTNLHPILLMILAGLSGALLYA